MEHLEIVCELCDRRMRLSESLLGKIAGKSGRVTCVDCSNKIQLDATHGAVRVTQGGRMADALDIEEIEDFSDAPPSVDPQLSMSPLQAVDGEGARDVPPPPTPEPGAESPHLRATASSGVAVASSGVAAAMQFSKSAGEFEAPAPDFSSSGSLSPHVMEADEDDGLVPLGREFNSSPYASERDNSYNSLFPQPARKTAPIDREAPLPTFSGVPSPPKRGELRPRKSEPELFKDEISTAPAVGATVVEMGPDGQLINQADKKERAKARRSQWVPWTALAVALLGWGATATFSQRDPVVIKAPDSAAAESTSAAAVAAPTDAPRPQELPVAEAEEAEAKAVEATTDHPTATSAATGESLGAGATLKSKKSKVAEQAESSPTSASAEPAAAFDVDAPEPTAETEEGSEKGEEEPVLPPFSPAVAASAMREATALAGACRKAADPTGYATVVVTFAPSGRVTQAAVMGAPFAGTETGGCIASRFRTARVPAFSGQNVTVKKTVTIQ